MGFVSHVEYAEAHDQVRSETVIFQKPHKHIAIGYTAGHAIAFVGAVRYALDLETMETPHGLCSDRQVIFVPRNSAEANAHFRAGRGPTTNRPPDSAHDAERFTLAFEHVRGKLDCWVLSARLQFVPDDGSPTEHIPEELFGAAALEFVECTEEDRTGVLSPG
jgi:hypothetical protein